MASKLLIF